MYRPCSLSPPGGGCYKTHDVKDGDGDDESERGVLCLVFSFLCMGSHVCEQRLYGTLADIEDLLVRIMDKLVIKHHTLPSMWSYVP